MRLTLRTVADVVGGALAGDPDRVVSSVSIDSRTLSPGGLFFALQGTRDGHEFVPDAFRAGAAAAVVSRSLPLPPGAGGDLVVVGDTAVALCALGGYARDRLGADDVIVVGITGSTGKTSTKDLVRAALCGHRSVTASPASWNNEIGVPLTLLSALFPAGAGTGVAGPRRPGAPPPVVISEMGARGVGHIAQLCAVARPTIGVVTNIGLAHAEFFGSRAEVARGKGELVEHLPADGHAVLSADDDMTPGLARRSAASVLTAGLHPSAEVRVSRVTVDDELRPSFHLDTPWGPADAGPLPVRGAHQAANAAYAVAVAGVLGIAPGEAAAGLAGTVGSGWRMEWASTPAGLVILNDAYNANPTSMAAALGALGHLTAARRVAVLGHMAELGAASDAEHHRVGVLAAEAGVDLLVVVGPGTGALAAGATGAGVPTVAVGSAGEAAAALAPRLRPGDAVLIKASRVVGLEQVAVALAGWESAPA